MIYLNPEHASALGDDTFWIWFKREFPSRYGIPARLKRDDVILQYSTLGFPKAGRSVAILWELYPEMREVFKSTEWDHRIDKVYECAKFCTFRTVSNPGNVKYYEQFGPVDVIPIGVDTDLFCPMHQKEALREKYNLPRDAKIGFWCGTTHPMKGFDLQEIYARGHPDIQWILVWKWAHETPKYAYDDRYVSISQRQISELMNCADFFLSTGRLKSYYMVEWEAMACDLPFVNLTDREFVPTSRPRRDVIDRGWDRRSVKRQWTKYLDKILEVPIATSPPLKVVSGTLVVDRTPQWLIATKLYYSKLRFWMYSVKRDTGLLKNKLILRVRQML